MRAPVQTRLATSLVLLSASSVARAQVALEWERAYNAPAGAALSGDAFAPCAAGGWYVAGGNWTDLVSLPGPNYFETYPLIQRLDAQGQTLWSTVIPITYQTLHGSIVLAAEPGGDAYLGYGSPGVKIERWNSAGNFLWSSQVAPTATGFVQRGFTRAPSGRVSGVVNLGAGFGWAAWDANGALLGETSLPGVPASSTIRVAASDASGRLAGAATNFGVTGFVFVVQPNGTLAWSNAAVDFQVFALAFGPAGELAAAGVDAANVPHLRVWDASGAQSFDTALASSPSSSWSDAAFDPWGGIAVAGGNGSDATLALYDASGALAWQRAWDSGLGFRDEFKRLRVLASGNVVAAGSTALDSGFPYYEAQSQLLVTGWRRNGDLAWEHRDPNAGTQIERTAELAETAEGSIVSAGTRSNQNFVNSGYTPAGVHVLSLRPQSRAFCFGDPLASACPCGNASVGGKQEGCANSTGRGAHLSDAGIASTSADTLVLSVEGTTPSAACLFFQGNALELAPFTLGDGARCVGGGLVRLYTRQASGGTVSVPGPGDPSVSTRSAAGGDPIAAGSTRYVQVYYRDVNGTFCPAPIGGTANVSSALALSWSP